MGIKVRAISQESCGDWDYLCRNWEKEPEYNIFGRPTCQYTFGAFEYEATIFETKEEAEKAVGIRNEMWGEKNPILHLEFDSI